MRDRGLPLLLTACFGLQCALAGQVLPASTTGTEEATRTSFYLAMRDGVRIAVDLSLPPSLKPGQKIPALLRQTRYYRSFDLGWKLRFVTRNWPSQRKLFLSQGYAWLDVDVRGTGASFGRWMYPWSPDEIRDGAEVVDWIIRQPWSNGKVGAIGASYDGGSAEFLLVNRHPAVKAAAPEFTFFDAYGDLAFPGGTWLQSFTAAWQQLDRALDIDYVKTIASMMPRVVRSSYRGVRPVDADLDRSLLTQALREHEHNLNVGAMAQAITYRDDAPWPPGLSLDAFSPWRRASDISASGASLYFVEGWLDAFPQAALDAFGALQNPARLMIGPWGHVAWMGAHPFGSSHDSTFNPDDQLLHFFDYHLKGLGGAPKQRSIAYFTLGANRWNTTDRWPPPGIRAQDLYLDGQQRLTAEHPEATKASDLYRVDLTAATGPTSRWDLGSEVTYPGRRRADRKLLCYTSRPLEQPMEVTGPPIVNLFVSSTAGDGEFFAYLEDVSPQGHVSYVTEGELRALHRLSGSAPLYSGPAPYHSFKRSDGLPLAPGELATLRFAMIPTSFSFGKGHSIRLALAGADRDHFALLPGPPPTWLIHRDADHASFIELPVMAVQEEAKDLHLSHAP